eukprot:236166-Chlamydomonas_euryale.AAC.2
MQAEVAELRVREAALRETVLALRKEVAEHEARSAAAAAHVAELRAQAGAAVDAAHAEADALRATLAEGGGRVGTAGGGGATTPVAPSPGIGMQFPTPPPPPVPSPGIGCQFPTPTDAAAGVVGKLGARGAVPPLGAGLPPASAAAARSRHLSGCAVRASTASAEAAASGSPVDGLCGEEEELSAALAPEASAPPPPGSAQQRQGGVSAADPEQQVWLGRARVHAHVGWDGMCWGKGARRVGGRAMASCASCKSVCKFF